MNVQTLLQFIMKVLTNGTVPPVLAKVVFVAFEAVVEDPLAVVVVATLEVVAEVVVAAVILNDSLSDSQVTRN